MNTGQAPLWTFTTDEYLHNANAPTDLDYCDWLSNTRALTLAAFDAPADKEKLSDYDW